MKYFVIPMPVILHPLNVNGEFWCNWYPRWAFIQYKFYHIISVLSHLHTDLMKCSGAVTKKKVSCDMFKFIYV